LRQETSGTLIVGTLGRRLKPNGEQGA
jgi:hypothetical protein